jgi:hypothetical protein
MIKLIFVNYFDLKEIVKCLKINWLALELWREKRVLYVASVILGIT